MAYFIRGTGDPRTPLEHERAIFKEYLTGTFFNTLLGQRGSGKPIIVNSDKFKGKGNGDSVRYHFVPQYKGPGIRGQNKSVTGNEKTIDEFYTDVRVDQIAQAFKSKGKVTELRTIVNYRDEFKTQLVNWFKMVTEWDMVAALTGYMTDGVEFLAGYNVDENGILTITGDAYKTPLVKGEGRCFRPKYDSKFTVVDVAPENTSNEALLTDMTSKDIMNTGLLDELQMLCKNANTKYAMKPIRMKDGNEYYMLLLHPRAALQLRQDERWVKRQLSNYQGVKTLESDPVATGAMGTWEKIIVKEADHISTCSNADGSKKIARNLLFGADAAVMGYAQTLDYTEEYTDYHRIFGVAADEIRGIKKLDFNGVDLNIAQVPTFI